MQVKAKVFAVFLSFLGFQAPALVCLCLTGSLYAQDTCAFENPYLEEFQRRIPQILKSANEFQEAKKEIANIVRRDIPILREEGRSPEEIAKWLSDASRYASKLESDMYINKEILPLAKIYAWAIPNEKAIKAIAKYGPIVEIGAGKGYWAHLLSQQSVDIVAYDKVLPKEPWFSVIEGDEQAILKHQDRTLFLCWPPQGKTYPLASRSLSLFVGKYVIYVGEMADGGATGDAEFFEILERDFHLVESVTIPRWPGYSDKLSVFVRVDS